MKIYHYHTITKELTSIFGNDKWEYVDVEDVAKIDIDNTSPSTETAFAKLSKALKDTTDKFQLEINKLKEKNEAKTQEILDIKTEIEKLKK